MVVSAAAKPRDHILDVVDIIVVDQPQIRGASSLRGIRDGETVGVGGGHGIATQRGGGIELAQGEERQKDRYTEREEGREMKNGWWPEKPGVFKFGPLVT